MFLRKQRALQDALRIGDQIVRRRNRELLAATFSAWHVQVWGCAVAVLCSAKLAFVAAMRDCRGIFATQPGSRSTTSPGSTGKHFSKSELDSTIPPLNAPSVRNPCILSPPPQRHCTAPATQTGVYRRVAQRLMGLLHRSKEACFMAWRDYCTDRRVKEHRAWEHWRERALAGPFGEWRALAVVLAERHREHKEVGAGRQ